ncbi:sugar ABC transporter substrate-binding protein [Xylanimonas ulmi]|uniref:Carbohydrate ABC transporter substrate-binding protein (CUT1 family) n=1 Tax=Xylanimonas ulmi TaxID=228973 RepID=A0A4Q7LYC2_9MICO|nr:extracellular solute-binding protein [Xylanibacterium ulmi]RZS59794.1 carbohydrate ABC transporter substrate-binding protein (CUT1 family) [Xylanibacterium ulmi]
MTRQPTRRLTRGLAAAAALSAVLGLTACGNGGGFADESPAADAGDSTDTTLSVLIGSSGDAETASVQAAIDAWSAATGHSAELKVATDLNQQLAQGFAAKTPPDVFYVSTESFPGWAENGSLWAYGDQLDAEFYPGLVDSFTFDGQFFAAPKDFSTLALIINDDAWQAAGLTDADYPTTWQELADVAETLTTDGQVGLSFGPEWARIGAFMAQAGGGLLDADGNAAVDSDANLQALEFVKQMLADGVAAFPSAIGAGWGGEAFGSGGAAMTIEGNWISGALSADFPDVNWTAVELPQGPGGDRGTLQFTNAWGIANDSQNKDVALSFVEFMVSDAQQMQFAKDFGVMPSVTSVADEWAAEFPEMGAFIRGGEYAQGVPPLQGIGSVLSDFNAQLEGLSTGDPASILSSVQSTLSALQ